MKRNSLNNDISRILDPSYSPASSNQPLSVYVDRHGYLHDPDYKHFPTITPSPNPNNISRPDGDDEDTAPVDSDFYSHLNSAFDRAGNAYVRQNKRHLNQYPQYSQYSHIYASYRSPYHYFSTPAPTTSSHSYSPPTSYDSDNTVLDDAAAGAADDSTTFALDDSHSHINICTLKKKLGKRRGSGSSNSNNSTAANNNSPPTATTTPSRRRKSTEERRPSDSPRLSASSASGVDDSFYHPHHQLLSPHNELDEQYLLSTSSASREFDRRNTYQSQQLYARQSQTENEKQEGNAHHEWTPTCTQSLRRQWQAVSLRFRFSLFRAQRRIKRRIQSMI